MGPGSSLRYGRDDKPRRDPIQINPALAFAFVAVTKAAPPDPDAREKRLLVFDVIEGLVVRLPVGEQRREFVGRNAIAQLAETRGEDGDAHAGQRGVEFARIAHGVEAGVEPATSG